MVKVHVSDMLRAYKASLTFLRFVKTDLVTGLVVGTGKATELTLGVLIGAMIAGKRKQHVVVRTVVPFRTYAQFASDHVALTSGRGGHLD